MKKFMSVWACLMWVSLSAQAALPNCPSGSFMGKNKLLIGAQMADSTASAAPFDVRYLYLAGGVPSSTSACTTTKCDSSCSTWWWGCWQDIKMAPGEYVKTHISKAEAAVWNKVSRPQIPAITYYEQLKTAGTPEGAAQVAKLNDSVVLTRYLNDWRFLLKTIDKKTVILHVEPDLWGFIRKVNSDPLKVPTQVRVAAAAECGGLGNHARGFARCMLIMARKYAPNAKIGFHASAWDINTTDDGKNAGAFMKALGANEADFIATDPADRDAGFNQSEGKNTWWDDAAAEKFIAWSRAVSDALGKPNVMWQIPLGNKSQNNTTNHWKDNRIDYLFAHLPSIRDAKTVALLFGAGNDKQTTPETDGGNLIAKTKEYATAGGVSLCQ